MGWYDKAKFELRQRLTCECKNIFSALCKRNFSKEIVSKFQLSLSKSKQFDNNKYWLESKQNVFVEFHDVHAYLNFASKQHLQTLCYLYLGCLSIVCYKVFCFLTWVLLCRNSNFSIISLSVADCEASSLFTWACQRKQFSLRLTTLKSR